MAKLKIGNIVAYDMEEACALLGISMRTLKTYIRQGKVKAVKSGRRYLIAEKFLEDFILGKSINSRRK